MGFFDGTPNKHTRDNFIEIPMGDHRAQICKVRKKNCKYGKTCFKITFKVSGYVDKIWYYLWDIPNSDTSSELKLKEFFDSFQIKDNNLDNYKNWVGKSGAIRVYHEAINDSFDDGYLTKIAFFIGGTRRDNLPPWSDEPVRDLSRDSIF